MNESPEKLKLHRWILCSSSAYQVPVHGAGRYREMEAAVSEVACPLIHSPEFQRVADSYFLRKVVASDPGSGIQRPHVWLWLIAHVPVPVEELTRIAAAESRGFGLRSMNGVEHHPILAPGTTGSAWRGTVRQVTEIALDLHCASPEVLRGHQIDLARLRGAWGGLRDLLEPYLLQHSLTYQEIHDSDGADAFWSAMDLEFPLEDPLPPWSLLFGTVLGMEYDWRDVVEELELGGHDG